MLMAWCCMICLEDSRLLTKIFYFQFSDILLICTKPNRVYQCVSVSEKLKTENCWHLKDIWV